MKVRTVIYIVLGLGVVGLLYYLYTRSSTSTGTGTPINTGTGSGQWGQYGWSALIAGLGKGVSDTINAINSGDDQKTDNESDSDTSGSTISTPSNLSV